MSSASPDLNLPPQLAKPTACVPDISPSVTNSVARGAPWGVWATLGLGLVIAAAYAAVQIVVTAFFCLSKMVVGHRIDMEALESNGLLLSIATCMAAPAAIGLSVLFAWLRRGLRVREYLGLKAASYKAYLWSLTALVALHLLWVIVVRVFQLPEVLQFMIDAYRTAGFLPLLWFAVVVVGPVTEEVFFRGFLFTGLRHSRLGAPGALLLTSLPWAAIHAQYDPYMIIFIFAFGLVFGFLRLKFDSIVPGLCLHAGSNLLSTVQLALSMEGF